MTNDSLGDFSLKPARDELAQRQSVKPKPARGKKPDEPKAPPSGSGQGLLWFVVLLLIAGGAGGGFILWTKIEQLQQRLELSTSNLSNAESAVSKLQGMLENRDNTLTKSGDQMLSDIKTLDSEVRKLWDLANKRNRSDIADLNKQLKSLQADIKSTKSSVAGVDKNLDSTRAQLTTLSKQLGELKENNSTLASSTDSVRQELARMKSVLGSAADFEDRITSLEVAIKSIDAYRAQINGKLEKLDREVGALQIPAGP